MRIRECLCERISVSQKTPEVNSIILDAITPIFNKKDTLPKPMVVEFLAKYNNLFTSAIKTGLTAFVKTTYNNDINIRFVNLKQGTGSYLEENNTINMTTKLIANLITIKINQLSGDTDFENALTAIVNKMAMIFLHELTHALQVQQGQRYEYKHGYIEREKVKFFTALVQDKFATTDEEIKAREIYKSQPDEIAAYGQQAAVELINKIYKLPTDEQLQGINIFLKNIASRSTHDYSKMRGRTEPGYEKSYRRFLKSVYQELDSYKDKLQELA